VRSTWEAHAEAQTEVQKQAESRGGRALREAVGEGGSRKLEPEALEENDLVVHRDVGVARVEALEHGRSRKTGRKQRYAKLRFADGAARVPFSKAPSVLYRYGEDEAQHVALGRLQDRSSWLRKVESARKVVQAQVASLLQLHRERMRTDRQPYPSPEPELERQFNMAFPFELTDDQKQAVNEIQADLSASKPMDRLLIGDVGFGKTEVAARAVFRAVSTGNRVMLLAPTAVLAKQHYESFRSRFEPLGFEVALLSRYQTEKEANNIRRKASRGLIPLVVGTHSLLSDKMSHEHLSLLIVDEEQRFGVKQKEKIKQARRNLDVLMLTATPIPRTLQLSMKGIRDVSVLQTAPESRQPIDTWVGSYSDDAVAKAIAYEINRGGQVLYVIPRIGTIEFEDRPLELQNMLRRMQNIDVSIAVAHGQQRAHELDNAMQRFQSGESSILIATAIVENGLDVPAVNTLIVEDAHNFGLAQMYQLRGRVGRREEQAYALLTYPQSVELTQKAVNRLRAIEECCNLGDGFAIAKYDASIRGGGSLFGTEQSGSSQGLGAEMYTEMLVTELERAERLQMPSVKLNDVAIKLSGIHPRIPPGAASAQAGMPPSEIERFEQQVLSKAGNGVDELNQVSKSISERFGQVPE